MNRVSITAAWDLDRTNRNLCSRLKEEDDIEKEMRTGKKLLTLLTLLLFVLLVLSLLQFEQTAGPSCSLMLKSLFAILFLFSASGLCRSIDVARDHLSARIVWNPEILSPDDRTVWKRGAQATVTWYGILSSSLSLSLHCGLNKETGILHTHHPKAPIPKGISF